MSYEIQESNVSNLCHRIKSFCAVMNPNHVQFSTWFYFTLFFSFSPQLSFPVHKSVLRMVYIFACALFFLKLITDKCIWLSYLHPLYCLWFKIKGFFSLFLVPDIPLNFCLCWLHKHLPSVHFSHSYLSSSYDVESIVMVPCRECRFYISIDDARHLENEANEITALCED